MTHLRCRDVTNADGTSNTLMMGHKAIQPQFYQTSDPGKPNDDVSWTGAWSAAFGGGIGNWYEHERWPGRFYQDYNDPANGSNVAADNWGGYMTAPHPGATPYLWADGSIRNLSYTINLNPQNIPYSDSAARTPSDIPFSRLWAFNDGTTLNVPD